jgi:thiamine biosynthesis protein ThiI
LYTDKIDESIDILKKIFGIYSVSPAVKTQGDMDSISKYAVDISKKILNKEKSFALRVTRTGNHDFTSQDVAVKVGADICKATKSKVNLTKPDFELFIEIRDKTAFIFTEKIHGAGGLPLGTQGKVLALIDSPISLLAAWYLMRRGCKATFVNIDTKYNKAIRSFARNWYVDEDLVNVNVHAKNLYKKLNEIASEKDCNAVVTSHSLYDAKSKFLTDSKQLKQYTGLPVLHPLIVMDQKIIKEKCKELGLKI